MRALPFRFLSFCRFLIKPALEKGKYYPYVFIFSPGRKFSCVRSQFFLRPDADFLPTGRSFICILMQIYFHADADFAAS